MNITILFTDLMIGTYMFESFVIRWTRILKLDGLPQEVLMMDAIFSQLDVDVAW
jgi:hypothetical protein